MGRGGGGGGGDTLIFSYRKARVIFLAQILNFNIFGGFQKNDFFFFFFGGGGGGCMKIMWIFFFGGGGHHKIELYLGVISMHFRVFSSGHGNKWMIFLGLLKFQIFLGALEIADIFLGVNGRCWARAYV